MHPIQHLSIDVVGELSAGRVLDWHRHLADLMPDGDSDAGLRLYTAWDGFAGAGDHPPMVATVERRGPAPEGWGHPESGVADELAVATFDPLEEHIGVSVGEPVAAILHVTVDVDRNHLDLFSEWYAGVHVPALTECPGVPWARRYEAAPVDEAPARHRFLTLYAMTGPEIVSSPAVLAGAERGACPAEIEPYREARNKVYLGPVDHPHLH